MNVNQTNVDYYNSLFSKTDFTVNTKPTNMDKDLGKLFQNKYVENKKSQRIIRNILRVFKIRQYRSCRE
jgi:altronate dehydratase